VSESKLRIGLVGLGDIGVRAHLPAIAAEPGVALVAVADAEADRLAEFAPAGVRTASDADAVFADPEVEAVVIATPPAATAGLVRAALDAGKYVLAEKPIALSVAEAADVRDAPGAAERLQIGLTYRHHPAVDRLRELIEAGALGRPLLIQAAICDERADPEGDPQGYARRLRSLERLPPIVSDGVHACDRLNYLLGEAPVEVTGWSLRTDPEYATANVNGGVLTYADGTVARLEVVWMTPVLPPSQFLVTGPLGRATLDPPTFRLSVELADGTMETLEPPGGKTETCFGLQLQRFVESALAGTPPVPGLDEALESLELAERIARAAGVARGVPA
jgi:predicted dehydrogenase